MPEDINIGDVVSVAVSETAGSVGTCVGTGAVVSVAMVSAGAVVAAVVSTTVSSVGSVARARAGTMVITMAKHKIIEIIRFSIIIAPLFFGLSSV